MNRSFVSEIEGAILNQVLSATRMTLGIVWKLMVSALALAILLGMVAGPGANSEKSSLTEEQPVKVQGEGNQYRVFTRIPSDKEVLQLELIDPVGKRHLHLTYHKIGLAYFSTSSGDPFQIGYVRRPGGDESANIRTPAAHYSVSLQTNGESGVAVTETGVVAATGPGYPLNLGEIWISPEGKRRSPSDLPK